MAQRTIIKYDGSREIQEHIIKITNITTMLKTLGMIVDGSFLVQFILNLLPPNYGIFQIDYNCSTPHPT
uniref:Uncharacterized protein n=1 Tax=Gossypium raimondii TaxID=29730 RepID=A0A0D2RY53_GOSRA|nr:hypothetical protein B456_012G052600 [Gossypium raimondii]